MILSLYGFLVLVSLVLIILGLTRPDESAQAIIGFFFLFLLSLILINGNLEVESGANVSTNYGYDGSGNVVSTNQSINYGYVKWQDDTSHNIGYWLAIASAVGLFGVLFSLDKLKNWFQKGDEFK